MVDIRTRIKGRVTNRLFPVVHDKSQIAGENAVVERKAGCLAVSVTVALIPPTPAGGFAQCNPIVIRRKVAWQTITVVGAGIITLSGCDNHRAAG